MTAFDTAFKTHHVPSSFVCNLLCITGEEEEICSCRMAISARKTGQKLEIMPSSWSSNVFSKSSVASTWSYASSDFDTKGACRTDNCTNHEMDRDTWYQLQKVGESIVLRRSTLADSDIISNDVAAALKKTEYAERRAFIRAAHAARECTPCRFFHDARRGCLIGDACVHCHDEHTKQYIKFAKKRNIKIAKKLGKKVDLLTSLI
jgi:hypothetical protein